LRIRPSLPAQGGQRLSSYFNIDRDTPYLFMTSGFESNGCDVAMVTLAFQGGGPERDSVLLFNGLAAKGLRVTILALREEGPLRSLVDPAIRVVVVPKRQMRYAIPALRRIIRALVPAVVVGSGIPSLNLALIAVRTLPRSRRPKLVLREGAVPRWRDIY
jgi:hypothetical protein